MSEEFFKKEFEEILSMLDLHQRFLVIGHVDPDGDCIGSILAIAQFLSARGKEVMCYAPGDIPEIYMKLPSADLFVSEEALSGFDYGMIFALDAPTPARTDGLVKRGDNGFVVNMDHHLANEYYGDINVVDRNAAAAAVLVYRFLSTVVPGEITASIADCLYLGILLDTGGFRFQNTNAEALLTAAKLIECGARAHELSHEFIYMKKFSILKLLAEVLESLEVRCGGKVAIMEVTMEMLGKNGCSMNDTEGFVDYASSIDDVELSALFREIDTEEVRVSLRSRDHYDVSVLAGEFGGGGHRNAAGLTIHGNLDKAKALIIQGFERILGDSNCSKTS